MTHVVVYNTLKKKSLGSVFFKRLRPSIETAAAKVMTLELLETIRFAGQVCYKSVSLY